MGPLLLRRTTPPCDWLGAVFFSLFDAAAGAVGSAAVEMRQEKFNYYDCEGELLCDCVRKFNGTKETARVWVVNFYVTVKAC